MKRLLCIPSVFSLVFLACGADGMSKAAGSLAEVSDTGYGTTAVTISDGSRKFIVTTSLTLRLKDLKNSEIKLKKVWRLLNERKQ
jgi:hypothetical protein